MIAIDRRAHDRVSGGTRPFAAGSRARRPSRRRVGARFSVEARGGPLGLPDDEVFVLRAVDGRPVPFTRTREDGSTVTVLADTLVLGRARFARTLVTRIRGADGESTSSASLEGELRPTGDVVVLAAECDDTRFALCTPPDTIVDLTGSELFVRSLLPPEGLKRFERP